jgi:hypothetical protein
MECHKTSCATFSQPILQGSHEIFIRHPRVQRTVDVLQSDCTTEPQARRITSQNITTVLVATQRKSLPLPQVPDAACCAPSVSRASARNVGYPPHGGKASFALYWLYYVVARERGVDVISKNISAEDILTEVCPTFHHVGICSTVPQLYSQG